jgi:hypothetical protein
MGGFINEYNILVHTAEGKKQLGTQNPVLRRMIMKCLQKYRV